MNNDRRKRIEAAEELVREGIEKLSEAKGLLDDILSEEQEAFDNMPESLQQSERGETASAAIEALESAVEALDADLEGDCLGQLETARQ